MHIERFFVPGLAHVSYVVASGTEAVVIDPERNVDYAARRFYPIPPRSLISSSPNTIS